MARTLPGGRHRAGPVAEALWTSRASGGAVEVERAAVDWWAFGRVD